MYQQSQNIHDASLEIGNAPDRTGGSRARLRELISVLKAEEPYVLGFPGNLRFGFSDLGGILDVLFNNVGDPGSREKSAVSTKPYEYQVVRFLARLAGGDPDAVYGFVSDGGSRSNLWALDLGYGRLPGAPIYCGEHAHFSVRESARLMRAELRVVPALPNGAMDTRVLAELCAERPGRGAVVVATIGTTMTGAMDDVAAIRAAAAPAGGLHVHADAALGGPIAMFAAEGRSWGFPLADSIAISGHKFFGMPVPCGIALAKRELVPGRRAGEYVGATNATLSSSRSGLAAALLWVSLRESGRDGLKANVLRSLEVAEYAEKRLAAIGLNAWRNPGSITVVFDRPDGRLCAKWHLATEGDLAHIVTVPHVTTEIIDELCRDLAG